MRHPTRQAHNQRRRIFVGCEGDSERGYIAFLAHQLELVHHKVHLDAKLLRPGGGDPLALMLTAETIVAREERNREPYERKFLLLDSDKLGQAKARDQQIPAVVARMDAVLIWQRTAHEALLLRHLPSCAARRPPTTALAIQQLQGRWPEYAKPMSALQLAARLDQAALRRVAAVEEELRALFDEIEML